MNYDLKVISEESGFRFVMGVALNYHHQFLDCIFHDIKQLWGIAPLWKAPYLSLITRDQDYEKHRKYELLMITVIYDVIFIYIYISLIVVKKR